MKKCLAAVVLIAAIVLLSVAAVTAPDREENEYIRIHIRADSNSASDQNVKYLVRDAVVDYLTPLLSECKTKSEAKRAIGKNLNGITATADNALKKSGMAYKSAARIAKEEFPVRNYKDITLSAGIYDALIIELGSGTGDNWWCVAFPPLCFLPESGDNLKYKSKIAEIIDKFFSED